MTKENPFSYDDSDDSTGFLLWKTYNLWQREIRRSLKEFNLTHTQFAILASTHWLTIQRDEVTQVEVAENAKIDVMLTSNVIRALEKRALVIREAHSTDTRAKKVLLTPTGFEVLKKAVIKVEDFDRAFFSKLADAKTFNKELISLTD